MEGLSCLIYVDGQFYLGVTSKKKNSIFVDIVQTRGGEVNPISKIEYIIIFWQKEKREGVINDF